MESTAILIRSGKGLFLGIELEDKPRKREEIPQEAG